MLFAGNIHLRAVEPEDAGFLYDLENDPDIWKVSNNLAPYSRYQIEQYVMGNPNDVVANKQLRLIISIREKSGKMVPAGAIDLFDVDLIHRRAGIGIIVINEYRRLGIAAESLKLMIRYCREHLQLVQVYCSVEETNKTSIRLFRQAGFIRYGIRKKWYAGPDGYTDEHLFQRFLHEA